MTSVLIPKLRKVADAGNLYVVNGRNIFYPLNLDADRIFSAYTALRVGVAGYWKLGEATGATRADSSPNGNTLTNNNNVTQVAGKIGNASGFVTASSQSLTCANNAGLAGGQDLTVAAWVNLTDLAGSYEIIDVSSGGASGIEWDLIANSAGAGSLNFRIGNGSTIFSAQAVGSLVAGTWAFCVGTFTLATGVLTCSLNLGTAGTANLTGTPVTGRPTFCIGGRSGPAVNMNGNIDAAGKWNRILTTPELIALYNGGAGVEIY